MQFLITAYDATDEGALERRKSVRQEHLANIKKVRESGSVVCAGGITDGEGKPIGSFLALDMPDRSFFDAYLESEPYVVHNVWQKIDVQTCNVVIVNDEIVGK